MQGGWKKNVAVFLGGQAVSLFGSALVQYAIMWHINLTTGSGLYVTLAVVFGFVPTFLLSPFAGVWADRYNRRVLIVVADACIALATLILAFVVRSGNNTLTPLYIALIVRSFGAAVQQPCVGAMLPSIVPEEQLTRINGINSSIQSVITIFSPMLAALLYGAAPFYYIFFVDVVTAAIGIFIMLFVFKYRHAAKMEITKNDYLGELVLGVKYVVNRSYLLIFFTCVFAVNFMFAPLAFLTPLQITRNYGANEVYLMWLEIAFSVGMIAGGILIAIWGGFRNRVHTMLFAGIIVSVTTIAVGFPMPLIPYLIIMLLCGVTLPAFNTPAMVLLQERVEDEYRGRVFSVLTMLSTAAMPLGMILFGFMSDYVSIESLLIATGILILGIGGILLTRKPLLAAGEPVVRLSAEGEGNEQPTPTEGTAPLPEGIGETE